MATAAEVKVLEINPNQVSNPIYTSRFQSFEVALNDLFIKELNSADSIFIRIAPGVVRKIAMFLSGMITRPASIGFAGETACGKSTIVLDSMNKIESFCKDFSLNNLINRINTDDYYYDRSEEVIKAGSFAEFAKNYDLDIPDAMELSLMKLHIQMLLDNQKVFLPKYDMSGTAKRIENHRIAFPSPIVIAEGLYTLIDGISDVFDFKIYVDIDKEVQKKRFFERAQQRGLGESAHRIFENASQKAQIYVHPCAENADIILNGETSRDKYKEFISNILDLVESNHYNFAV